MAIKVLCIAPVAPKLPPLALFDEISQIAAIDGVHADILGSAQATRQNIARALRQEYEIIIWAGHGTANRLVCSDGTHVSGIWMATQARPAAPRALVVAACLSAAPDDGLDSLVQALSEAGINAIGMFTEVDDRAAIVYDVEFVRAIVAGANVGRAHRVAMEEMATVSRRSALAAVYMPAESNGYRDYQRQLKTFDTRLQNVEVAVRELVEKPC